MAGTTPAELEAEVSKLKGLLASVVSAENIHRRGRVEFIDGIQHYVPYVCKLLPQALYDDIEESIT